MKHKTVSDALSKMANEDKLTLATYLDLYGVSYVKLDRMPDGTINACVVSPLDVTLFQGGPTTRPKPQIHPQPPFPALGKPPASAPPSPEEGGTAYGEQHDGAAIDSAIPHLEGYGFSRAVGAIASLRAALASARSEIEGLRADVEVVRACKRNGLGMCRTCREALDRAAS